MPLTSVNIKNLHNITAEFNYECINGGLVRMCGNKQTAVIDVYCDLKKDAKLESM